MKQYSVFHLLIYHKLKEKANNNRSKIDNTPRYISCGEALEIMRRTLGHVPLKLHHRILKELEEINLIKKENKMNILIFIGGSVDEKLKEFFDALL